MTFRCAPPPTVPLIFWEQHCFTRNAASTRVQDTGGGQGMIEDRRGGDGRSRSGLPALNSSASRPTATPVQPHAGQQLQGVERVKHQNQSHQSSNLSHPAPAIATMGKVLVFN